MNHPLLIFLSVTCHLPTVNAIQQHGNIVCYLILLFTIILNMLLCSLSIETCLWF